MPDAVCDSKLLKKSLEENRRIVHEADAKIDKATSDIKRDGKYPKEGLSFLAHMAGLFGQRLWFYKKRRITARNLGLVIPVLDAGCVHQTVLWEI